MYQPTQPLRRKDFYQPLAAAARQLKERQSPKEAAELGAPLWVPTYGAEAADRTAIFRAHRPSGRERSEAASSQAPYRSQRPKCRRSLIPLLVLFPREPLRLRSRGSPARPGVIQALNQIKKISFPPAAAHFLFQRKWGAANPPPLSRRKNRLARNGGIFAASLPTSRGESPPPWKTKLYIE